MIPSQINLLPTLVNVEVNGLQVAVKLGATVLQACEAAGIEIPRFCYHERLLVAGNCRMCLVEIGGSPKPQASCALPVGPNMKIFTDSPRVKKARESVMEFLLLNHPLDCPICDQGGECDRQDQSMVFGSDRSRMFETKRGVEDKDLGPLIKTVMTRCIHCTRCIRFASEVAGVADRGTSGRGRETEVGTYVAKVMKSEVSGNLIDLCPVGALTSKPYAFVARPWELETVDTVDTLDGFGASVRVQSRGQTVRRIQPRENDELNQAWLGDKSRFITDAVTTQRVTTAYACKDRPANSVNTANTTKQISPVPMSVATSHAANRLMSSDQVQIVVSPSRSLETLSTVRQRRGSFPASTLTSISARGLAKQPRFGEASSVDTHGLMGLPMAQLANADLCVLVGLQPRHEAPLLNLILRDGFLRDRLEVVSRGPTMDLTFPVTELGRSPARLTERREGDHERSVRLAQAKRPVILVGSSLTTREDGPTRTARRRQLAHNRVTQGSVINGGANGEGWQVLNFYHPSASTTGALSLGRSGFQGWKPHMSSSARTTLMRVGVGQADFQEAGVPQPDLSSFHGLISLSTHGDERIAASDVVFPRPLSFEARAHYMNTEGRVQATSAAVCPPFQVGPRPLDGMNYAELPRVQVASLMSKGSTSGKTLSNTQSNVMNSNSWRTDSVASGSVNAILTSPTRVGGLNTRLAPSIHDYYLEGHALARFSSTMAKASRELGSPENFAS